MGVGTLDGIRVLDFTLAAVGPFCSRILADMGAEVIRVEWPRIVPAPGQPDPGRFTAEGIKSGAEILFLHCNGGKKSLCVNLKDDRGVEIVRSLASQVDVVVENFTPRVMRSFGLDYECLSAINPRIIMCSLSGYGQRGYGGNEGHACTDPIAQAMGGLSWITGERTGPPYAIGGGIGDTMTAMAGAIAVGMALFHRERTGVGQHIDLAMVDTVLFADCVAMPYVAANNGGPSVIFRNGQLNTFTCPMGPFKCGDGYVALQAPGAGADSPWGRLCHAMGRPDLIDDPRYQTDRDRIAHTDEIIALIEDWLQGFPDAEVAVAILADARISSGPVLSQEQILNHWHFRGRGAIGSVQYPEVGDVKVVEPPFKFSATEVYVRGPAPQFGEHNAEVLAALGLTAGEIEALAKDGVLFESPASHARRSSASATSGGEVSTIC